MNEKINKFFEAYSKRAYKENDLSDVTYALCVSNPEFKQFFFDFLFGDGVINASKAKMEREHAFADNGRPDFVITPPDDTFLIEVKIWDGDHHLLKYQKILEDANETETNGHLAYIANYELKQSLKEANNEVYMNVCSNGMTVKTWKELVDSLGKCNCFNDDLISAYVSYVKKVCPFDDFTGNINTEINLSDFHMVKALYTYITESVNDQQLDVSLYSGSSKNFSSKNWMGQYPESVKKIGKRMA